jgi:hypothetical protein
MEIKIDKYINTYCYNINVKNKILIKVPLRQLIDKWPKEPFCGHSLINKRKIDMNTRAAISYSVKTGKLLVAGKGTCTKSDRLHFIWRAK